MKIRHFVAGLILIGAVVAGGIVTTSTSSAETTGTIVDVGACPSQMAVTKPFNGETVSGIVTFEAAAPQIFNVSEVKFRIKDEHVFSAQKYTDPYWRAPLDTRISELDGNRQYQAFAVVFYSTTTGTTYKCQTPEITITVNNAATTPANTSVLEITPSLQQWTGPTNVPFEVVMKANMVTGTARTDVTQQASYVWSITKGVLTPQGYRAGINSGPSTGDGTIKVKVTYGGQVKELSIPMKVQSSTTASNYPAAPTGTQTTASKTVAPADQPKTIQEAESTGLFQTALSKNGQGDAELERCLSHALGEAVYQERLKQQSRLDFQEIIKSEQCFARLKQVVPANLAPISPADVKKLPVSKQVKLEKFEKVSKNNKDVLEIKGTAKPNQLVIIYVFSEPLVLAAKADGDGKWTYILEDPMEPGDHQAYVTVEGADNQPERSDSFGFAVVAAPKTALNPLGLSFAVKEANKPKLFIGYYIAAAVGLVLIAVLMSIWLMRRRAKQIVAGEFAPAITTPGAAVVSPNPDVEVGEEPNDKYIGPPAGPPAAS